MSGGLSYGCRMSPAAESRKSALDFKAACKSFQRDSTTEKKALPCIVHSGKPKCLVMHAEMVCRTMKGSVQQEASARLLAGKV